MPAPEVVRQLVERFEEHKLAYLSPAYLEAQLRQEFLNPFFEALGWDVANKQGYAVQYREVVHEDSIHIKGSPNAKAPDYAFRLGGVRKFFVEAKKPAEDIENTREYAYQLKVYAWNLGLPLSILTDFEGFAVYDCRNKPKPTDSPATGRVMFIRYDEYIDRWDEIAGIFSLDAIRKGAFDQYAEDNTAKKGTIKVDDAFLQEIETWRTLLARNIALRNEQITNERQLNYAVQMTISRVIFLRICEDRGIEPQNQLLELSQGKEIYPQLVALYMKADQKYNSGLFHFRPEVGKPNSVDTFTPGLMIDDKVIKTIILSLYYPSPYVFKEIPVEILGQVYERFLGKVIRLTPARHAKIEEKPEVRKAGGVYYTPKYIVDYIVENTVGKLLEDKTPQEAAQLTIVDPACGSGSFLLGAYQYLLDWHESWYLGHDPEGWTRGKQPALVHTAEGDWRLTTEEKKRILLNNIYGVDIDAQAVEVTKLSLLLKVLEEETGQLSLGFERALPDLGDNIKCGNSLIGWDYFEGQLIRDEKEVERVNPFDWQRGFPAVFAKGGFDAVIGNPPYRRELDYKELMDEIAKSPLGKKYRRPRMDFWYYFVHRGLEILCDQGLLSFIVNSYWISGTGSEKLINTLKDTTHIEEIFFLGKANVFNSVSGQHMIFRLRKRRNNEATTEIKLIELTNEKNAEPFFTGSGKINRFAKKKEHLYFQGKINIMPYQGGLYLKISENSISLEDLGTIRQGIAENPSIINKRTSEKYNLKSMIGKGVFVLSEEEIFHLNLPFNEKRLLRTYYRLEDMGRYYLSDDPKYSIIYSTKETCPNINNYPIIKDHLRQFKSIMDERRETKKGSIKWWHLHWPREESLWRSSKILSIQMGKRPSFVPALAQTYVPFSVNVFVPYEQTKDNIYYLTGLLNSKLLWNWFSHNAKRRGVGLEINGNVLKRTPIHVINLSNNYDNECYLRIVSLVEHMLELHKRTPQTPHEKQLLQREIDATDAQIDRLVYKLYGLTEEEIKIVEGE